MDTHWPRLLLSGLLLSAALAPPALVQEDDDDDDPGGPEVCTEPLVDIAGSIYLNGLPLVQQDLELVGDAVQVTVEKPPYCHTATLLGLPYRWRVSGPTGAVTLTGGDTLRPHFHPALLGTYRAVLTYCPQTCSNWPVGGTLRVDVPPRSVELTFAVASELPVPPATEPVPTRFASDYPTIQWVALDNEERRRKCGLPGIAADWFTPQLVPTRPWTDQQNYQLVEGLVVGSRIAGHDNELNHSSHDAIVEVQPDGRYGMHKVPP
ncbi:MAG TPA: hypothetical protein VF310_00475, partial [Vicinamibacteria bacterium]